jgi:ankyrin repeat protein
MNELLKSFLARTPDKYPHALERDYPRIVEKIVTLWGKDEFDDYLAGLMVADTETRQGFPPDVGREILQLSLAYEKWKQAKAEEDDPWANERKMTREESEIFVRDLQRRGQDLTPQWMFKLVEQGDTAGALNFLRAGMDVDIRRLDEWTPLMVALFNGHEDTALMLLQKGANVRARAKRGYEPLHWAALNGYERAVDFILRKGGNVNATTDYGFTPLLQAATRGQLNIVKMLVAKGAAVNIAEHEGYTPLHKACANGHVEVARYLLEHGADPKAEANNGDTPVALAMKTGNQDLMGLFLG